MNWHLLGISFLMVFLSELGDKSQLAAITLSSRSKSPRAVFFGTATALILTSLLGALIGGRRSGTPHIFLKASAAVGFAFMGVYCCCLLLGHPARIYRTKQNSSTLLPVLTGCISHCDNSGDDRSLINSKLRVVQG